MRMFKLFVVAAILSLGVDLMYGQDVRTIPGKYLPAKSQVQATPARNPAFKRTQDKKVEPAPPVAASNSPLKPTQGKTVDQVPALVEEVAELRKTVAALNKDLAKLRAEYEDTKRFVRTNPPKGYSAAAITKRNWDRLSDNVLLEYWSPLSEDAK